MRFKRRPHDAEQVEPTAEASATTSDSDDSGTTAGTTAAPVGRDAGPFDISEVTVDPADQSRVDLGALIVQGMPDVEMRLQVDEASGEVAALLLVAEDGAVEIRAFASPRNDEIWGEVRASIVEEAQRQGGAVDEVEGPWGDELKMLVQGQTEDGQLVTQATRVVGITGPRWLLRATYFGAPAAQDLPDHPIERALRAIVVRRGQQAMPPGEFLPLVLPAHARRMG